MKKLISLILALILFFMLVPAVAEVDITGDWYASFAGVAMTMTINANGTMVVTAPGQEGTAEGTWTLEGDQLTLTVDGSPATATVNADGILLSSDGLDLLFTREPIEAPSVGEVKPAAAAEEFYGEWTIAYMESDGILLDPSVNDFTMPMIVLGERTVKFVATDETDFMAPILNALGLVSTYKNGALKLTATTEGAKASGKVEVLTDGKIKFSLDYNGTDMVFYYKPVEKNADLVLPTDLTEISAEAFRNGNYHSVYCSGSVVSIGKYAFADNSSLEWIYLPFSVTSIDATAFSGCPDSLIIYGTAGSYAQEYAEAAGFTFIIK